MLCSIALALSRSRDLSARFNSAKDAAGPTVSGEEDEIRVNLVSFGAAGATAYSGSGLAIGCPVSGLGIIGVGSIISTMSAVRVTPSSLEFGFASATGDLSFISPVPTIACG